MAVESKIRSLHADEIECRVGSIGEKGISLLLYKNARVDQAILDEAFGIYGWQRSHMMIGKFPVLYREYLGPGEKDLDIQAGCGNNRGF